MILEISSRAMSNILSTVVRVINDKNRAVLSDLFAGCGGIEGAIGRYARQSFDEHVTNSFNGSVEKDNNLEKQTTTTTASRITTTDGFSGNTKVTITPTAAYYLTNGEQAANNGDEPGVQYRAQGHSRACGLVRGGLWPQRGAACLRGYGAPDGLCALVGLGGEEARDEVLQGGASARKARDARDGARQAACRRNQREHQPAAGAGWRQPSARCGHRTAEHRRRREPILLFKTSINLKTA